MATELRNKRVNWFWKMMVRIRLRRRRIALNQAIALAKREKIDTGKKQLVFLVNGRFIVITKQELKLRMHRLRLFKGMTPGQVEKKARFATL